MREIVQPATAGVGRILRRLGLSLMSSSGEMVDWYTIAGTGMDVAGEGCPAESTGFEAAEEFADYIRKVEPRVAEFTGLKLSKPLVSPVVLNRSEWIAVTAANLKPILETVLTGLLKPEAEGDSSAFKSRRLSRAAMSGEIGLALGYLAGRVLGQYDVSFISEEDRPSLFYFIYPNIAAAERKLGIDSRSFRMWLALHEVTHGYQFEANPWLKTYIRSLVDENVEYMEAKLKRLKQPIVGDEEPFDWLKKLSFLAGMRDLASPEENPVLAKVQSLMSILEGYSEYVMDTAGAEIVGDAGIAGLLDQAREQRHWLQRFVERFIGLETKIQQYRQGYAFVAEVAEVGGMEFANYVWAGPKSMPTLTELRQPELWITRMMRGSTI